MPVTIDLTEQERAEIKAFTKESHDLAAVRSAMTEYLRFARRLQLKAMSGHVQMEEDDLPPTGSRFR